MKTAEEILKATLGNSIAEARYPLIIEAMHEYASQAIDEAAEKAECKNEGTYGGDGESMDYYVVDKQSILKVKAELK